MPPAISSKPRSTSAEVGSPVLGRPSAVGACVKVIPETLVVGETDPGLVVVVPLTEGVAVEDPEGLPVVVCVAVFVTVAETEALGDAVAEVVPEVDPLGVVEPLVGLTEPVAEVEPDEVGVPDGVLDDEPEGVGPPQFGVAAL